MPTKSGIPKTFSQPKQACVNHLCQLCSLKGVEIGDSNLLNLSSLLFTTVSGCLQTWISIILNVDE